MRSSSTLSSRDRKRSRGSNKGSSSPLQSPPSESPQKGLFISNCLTQTSGLGSSSATTVHSSRSRRNSTPPVSSSDGHPNNISTLSSSLPSLQFKRPTTRNDHRHARKQMLMNSTTAITGVSGHYNNSKYVLEAICDTLEQMSQNDWLLGGSSNNSTTGSSTNNSYVDEHNLMMDSTSYQHDYKDWKNKTKLVNGSAKKAGRKTSTPKMVYQSAPFGVLLSEPMKSLYNQDFDICTEKLDIQNKDRILKNPILNNPWNNLSDTDTIDEDDKETKINGQHTTLLETVNENECIEEEEKGIQEDSSNLAAVVTSEVNTKEPTDLVLMKTNTLFFSNHPSERNISVEDFEARDVIGQHRRKTSSSMDSNYLGRQKSDTCSVFSYRSSSSHSSWRSGRSRSKLGKPVYLQRYQPLLQEIGSGLEVCNNDIVPSRVATPIRRDELYRIGAETSRSTSSRLFGSRMSVDILNCSL